MLFEASYYSKETTRRINELVGKPVSLIKRLKMGGIGSQRLLIIESNEEIQKLIDRQNTPPYTNIELRPKGIILWFRVKLDNWVLVLPYYKLTIFKNEKGFSLFSDHWKLKFIPANNVSLNTKFIQKMIKGKADNNLAQTTGPNG